MALPSSRIRTVTDSRILAERILAQPNHKLAFKGNSPQFTKDVETREDRGVPARPKQALCNQRPVRELIAD